MAANTMDAIRKKMQTMRVEKEAARDRAEQFEHDLLLQTKLNEQKEDEIQNLQKHVSTLEGELDKVHSLMASTSSQLDTTEKQLTVQEAEIASFNRRTRLVDEDFEQTSARLQIATDKLQEASKLAEETERNRKALECRNSADEERITFLELQLKEAKLTAEDADRKHEEASRKLAVTEVYLGRSESRLEAAEMKIVQLKNELKTTGYNMKSLETAEQELSDREGSYEEIIRDLTLHLKETENRAAEAERATSRLQKEIDRLEDELLAEKEKYRTISEDLDGAFLELATF